MISSAFAGWLACIAPSAQARDPAPDVAAPLAVDGVDVEQVATLASGVPLRFTVFGTARARAVLRIEGARRMLELRETDPGVYEGTYVIDPSDAIDAGSRVTASLQRAGDVAHAGLDEPLLLASGPLPWAAAAAAPAPAPRDAVDCRDCAVVESVQAVDAPPRGGVVGAIGGAIAGAVLGKELGAAHTRRVLSVLGAIGGALTGREIERQATRSATQYDVVLRRADGTVLKRRYEEAPPFAVGQTIRLDGAARAGTSVPATL